MELTPLAPPSVQLVPAKEYRGAPIGTSYDVRAYVGKSYINCQLSTRQLSTVKFQLSNVNLYFGIRDYGLMLMLSNFLTAPEWSAMLDLSYDLYRLTISQCHKIIITFYLDFVYYDQKLILSILLYPKLSSKFQ